MSLDDIKKLTKSEMINYLYVRDIIKDTDNPVNPTNSHYALYIILSLIIILIFILIYMNYKNT